MPSIGIVGLVKFVEPNIATAIGTFYFRSIANTTAPHRVIDGLKSG